MKGRLLAARRIATVSLLVGSWLLAPPAGAEQQYEIRKLRDEKVALYECDDVTKPALQYPRERFQAPWMATKDPDKPMFFRVEVDGATYCVKAHMVETAAPVPATKSGTECKPGKQPPRAGFTRGMGEGCNK
jgi:hypothetical protein